MDTIFSTLLVGIISETKNLPKYEVFVGTLTNLGNFAMFSLSSTMLSVKFNEI